MLPSKMWLGAMPYQVTQRSTILLAILLSNIIVSVSALEESQAPSAVPIDTDAFRWTPLTIAQAIVIFVLSGFAEIGGGWMVWKAVRDGKPWWWALVGSFVMVLYAFLPTLQPTESFGRIYAVYGGFFIGLSYIWGWGSRSQPSALAKISNVRPCANWLAAAS